MKGKSSFVCYSSWASYIASLPDEQAAQLSKAIAFYHLGQEYEIKDQSLRIFFASVVRPQMEADSAKYQERIENAKRSTAKRIDNSKSVTQSEKANASVRECTQSDASVRECTQAKDSVGVSVSDSVSVSVSDSVSDNVSVSVSEKDKEQKKSAEKKPYSDDPELEQAIEDFVENRKVNKKPMTERAITLLINRLEQLAPGDNKKKIELLNIAILHGWQSVYIPRDRDIPGKQSSGSGYIDAINHRMDSLKEWAEDNGINTDDTEEGSMF